MGGLKTSSQIIDKISYLTKCKKSIHMPQAGKEDLEPPKRFCARVVGDFAHPPKHDPGYDSRPKGGGGFQGAIFESE